MSNWTGGCCLCHANGGALSELADAWICDACENLIPWECKTARFCKGVGFENKYAEKYIINKMRAQQVKEIDAFMQMNHQLASKFQETGIVYESGMVFDENSTILRDVGIDIQLAMDFKRFAAEHYPDLVVSAYLYNVWLAEDPWHPVILQETEISGCTPLKGSLNQVASAASHIHKLLCMGDAMRIRALQKEIPQHFPKLMALRCKPTYLEILPQESTKGSAVQVLLDYYGLSPKQAVAFGDSDVDVDMLQYCGLGVAMGNAPKQVKEAADYVTASNDQEGVYIALNSLRLKAPGGSRKTAKVR